MGTSAGETTRESTFAQMDVVIYYGNANADGFETVLFQVPDINSQILLKKLVEVGVLTKEVTLQSEKIDGTCLYLDFNSAFRDLVCAMGTSGEYLIMGSVVNTFLENYPGTVASVYITVNGEILESGHVIYDFAMTYYG